MPAKQLDLLRATLDLLVLKALALGPLHGLAVSQRIEQVTKGAFQVKPVSHVLALHGSEETGRLESLWGESENAPKAKYYALTKAGRRPLAAETREWRSVSLAAAAALETP
jgi:PadR family transcriptional regulator, regulatory protein PadR